MRGTITGAISALALAFGCSPQSSHHEDACISAVRHAQLIMRTYDNDHDGRLNRSEWTAIADQLNKMTQDPTGANSVNSHGENLKQVAARDTNNDGYIDLKELAVVANGFPMQLKSCL